MHVIALSEKTDPFIFLRKNLWIKRKNDIWLKLPLGIKDLCAFCLNRDSDDSCFQHIHEGSLPVEGRFLFSMLSGHRVVTRFVLLVLKRGLGG